MRLYHMVNGCWPGPVAPEAQRQSVGSRPKILRPCGLPEYLVDRPISRAPHLSPCQEKMGLACLLLCGAYLQILISRLQSGVRVGGSRPWYI